LLATDRKNGLGLKDNIEFRICIWFTTTWIPDEERKHFTEVTGVEGFIGKEEEREKAAERKGNEKKSGKL